MEKPSILLVDDHPANLIALEAVIGTSEYHLVTAASGAEALRAVEQHDFAIILLDVHMPEFDGYEVTRLLKASPRTQHIPIFLITAVYREDPHVARAYELGAVEFFSKPFNPDVLRRKVGVYAELHRKSRQLQKQEEARRQVLQRTAELHTVLEHFPDAVYLGDAQGITRWNEAATALFGLAAETGTKVPFESLAERIALRYPGTDKPIPRDDQPFAHALRGETYLAHVTIKDQGSGKDCVIACSAGPVWSNANVVGAVVVNALVREQDDLVSV